MYTLYDLVSRILDSRDGYGDATNERRALRSAIWGCKQVTSRHSWRQYRTETVFQLHAPVTVTASVTTGGVATVSSGTLPAWIDSASAYIINRNQVISEKLSDTEFKVDGYSGPALTDASIRIVHNRYPMHDRIREVFSIRNETNGYDMRFCDAMSFRTMSILDTSTADPHSVTYVRYSYKGTSRTELRFSPAPSADVSIRMDYYRDPRSATISHDCGLVDIDHTTGIVTLEWDLNRQSLADAMSGSLRLLVSPDEGKPDAILGFSVVGDTFSEFDLEVASIESTSQLTLADEIDESVTDRGAVLTHVLDIPESTWEAAAMYGEAKYMQIGEGSVGDYWQASKIADAELRTAMEQERKLTRERETYYTRPFTYIPPDIISLD